MLRLWACLEKRLALKPECELPLEKRVAEAWPFDLRGPSSSLHLASADICCLLNRFAPQRLTSSHFLALSNSSGKLHLRKQAVAAAKSRVAMDLKNSYSRKLIL